MNGMREEPQIYRRTRDLLYRVQAVWEVFLAERFGIGNRSAKSGNGLMSDHGKLAFMRRQVGTKIALEEVEIPINLDVDRMRIHQLRPFANSERVTHCAMKRNKPATKRFPDAVEATYPQEAVTIIASTIAHISTARGTGTLTET